MEAVSAAASPRKEGSLRLTHKVYMLKFLEDFASSDESRLSELLEV